MLGWVFSINSANEHLGVIARWNGGLFSDHWLYMLEKQDKAYLVKNKGGYPNTWKVRSEDLLKSQPHLASTEIGETEWTTVEVWDQS